MHRQSLATGEGSLLSSIASLVPSSMAQVSPPPPSMVQVLRMGARVRDMLDMDRVRQELLTMLRPVEPRTQAKEGEEEEVDTKEADVDLPFLTWPLGNGESRVEERKQVEEKGKKEKKKNYEKKKTSMVEELLPPKKRVKDDMYAVRRFEERFR